MTKYNGTLGNTYTVLVGQQPIGMARADNPRDAVSLIQRLCDEPLDASELRIRAPTANEAEIFDRQCGTTSKDGVVGFCF